MIKAKPIYTVTTVRGALAAGSRAVGFYYTFEEANECIENNDLDINEAGYYHFAVIEKVIPGLYTYPRDEFWYRWDNGKEQYIACEKPERFKQVCGWSLG